MYNSDCKDILDLIPLYIDNKLSEEDYLIVQNHINSCESCKKELEFMVSFTQKFRELPQIDISPDFHENLMEKAKKNLRNKELKRITYLRRGGAGVAAAVVALFISYSNIKPAPPVANDDFNDTALNSSQADKPLDITADKNIQAKTSKSPAFINEPDTSSKETNDTGTFPDSPEEDVFLQENVTVIDEEVQFSKSIITANDENREEILSILSTCEKDSTGYKSKNPEKLLQKLLELGCTIETVADETININYIILK